ncbi:conserved hypothetical protein [Methylobacterium sp. 4-46]|uniref:hypothetical protein n=1 Tax=unclassified Methylobacterium TaxID=2615210 RepID=UPI000152DC0F|nr:MULTISPECIES: hypothetical protein [Methylobacterium]ACA15145.1 conserved hypothetical protein [Methylobacterium sp. 4-46]WFT80879.1 hypothetical protein QA634_02960 [Methylobacterium nodulans]
MTPRITAAVLGLLALQAPALAQGTPEQRQACTPDAMSLCGPFIPDAVRVKACLLHNRQRLTPACRAAIVPDEPRRPRRRRRAR